MGFRNFRFNIVFRAILLAVFLLFTIWGFLDFNWKITPYIGLVLSLLVVVELIHYVERINRKLRSFLDYIRYKDFSNVAVEETLGKSFSELSDSFKNITNLFRQINAEKAASAQYLELIVERINLALLCFNSEGKITLINRRAKALFQLPYIASIKRLKKVDEHLPEFISKLTDNEQQLFAFNVNNERLLLAVRATEFMLLDEKYKLVSFQNIRDELEQHEIGSWQKLIRVLTHEIMNSVTPIISLAEVLKDRLLAQEGGGNTSLTLSCEDLDDLKMSIRSIESRSKGLHRFVQTYRRLTSIPAPNIQPAAISNLLNSVGTLMLPEMEKRSITFKALGNCEGITVNADSQQLEQVLINLIKNAMEALEQTSSPEIGLLVKVESRNYVLIQVVDNGPGIKPENLEQIFVPFFTTKANGSGIGLSISRQLIIQNKGLISVVSTPGRGSNFALRFRCRVD